MPPRYGISSVDRVPIFITLRRGPTPGACQRSPRLAPLVRNDNSLSMPIDFCRFLRDRRCVVLRAARLAQQIRDKIVALVNQFFAGAAAVRRAHRVFTKEGEGD